VAAQSASDLRPQGYRRMRRRQGFTLIELLVGMGLTMFIMVILSQAFATGTEVFTQMKAIGDMEANMRSATTILRADLAADHFEAKRRLCDGDISTLASRPRQGFFRIHRGAAAFLEGADGDGIPTYRSGQWQLAGNPPPLVLGSSIMHMSVKRRGNRREDF